MSLTITSLLTKLKISLLILQKPYLFQIQILINFVRYFVLMMKQQVKREIIK